MKQIFWLAGLLVCVLGFVHCAEDTNDCVKFCDKVVHAEWPNQPELACTGTCYAKYVNVNCANTAEPSFPTFCVDQCSGRSGTIPCILERTCESVLDLDSVNLTYDEWNAEGSKVVTIENGENAADCQYACDSATGGDAMPSGFADCIELANTCPELLYCQAALQVYYK